MRNVPHGMSQMTAGKSEADLSSLLVLSKETIFKRQSRRLDSTMPDSVSWRIKQTITESVANPGILFGAKSSPSSFLPSFLPSFPSSFPIPFFCITLIPSSPFLSFSIPYHSSPPHLYPFPFRPPFPPLLFNGGPDYNPPENFSN
jgi:hypothetical protein